MATEDALLALLDRLGSDFARIARASRGEWLRDDVRNEAWLMTVTLGERLGRPFDPDDDADVDRLLAWLYNHCVRYGEQVVRKATRLDHAPGADDDRGHPLLARLTAPDAEPLAHLEARENADTRPMPAPYESAAAAWLWLLGRFDGRMPDVACFLHISLSWSYACCRRAARHAALHAPLPQLPPIDDVDHALRAWRRFKLPPRTPGSATSQLRLDFWPAPPERGQPWLL
ncbi:MAG TPA: hypothetical protein VIG88_05590 [Lysobacter sp.]